MEQRGIILRKVFDWSILTIVGLNDKIVGCINGLKWHKIPNIEFVESLDI